MAPPSREELIALCAVAPEQVADLVLALYTRVQALEAEVQELRRRLGLNSNGCLYDVVVVGIVGDQRDPLRPGEN